MANIFYTRGSVLFAGSADWSSTAQTYRVLLATDEYRPDAKHRFVSDVKGEIEGSGYERKDLTGRVVTSNAECLADSISFSKLRSVQTYKWAVVFKLGKSDKDSELICALDMDGVSLRAITDHKIKWDGQAKAGRIFSLA